MVTLCHGSVSHIVRDIYRSFSVFLYKLMNKQPSCWQLRTPWCSRDVNVIISRSRSIRKRCTASLTRAVPPSMACCCTKLMNLHRKWTQPSRPPSRGVCSRSVHPEVWAATSLPSTHNGDGTMALRVRGTRSLKTESYHNDNFFITGGTGGRHCDNSWFSVHLCMHYFAFKKLHMASLE